MSKYRNLDRGDVLPASWTDQIQEFVASLATNLRIQRASDSVLEIPAGSGDDQVAIGIDGLWRYRSSTVNASGPGGSAAVHDVWVVASANIFSDSPAVDTDTTDYTFGLVILASGTPTGNYSGRAITGMRKIGEAVWDGSKYTEIRQLVGKMRDTMPVVASAPSVDAPAGVFRGLASQAAPVLLVENSAGLDLFYVEPDGDVHVEGDLTVIGNLVAAALEVPGIVVAGNTRLGSDDSDVIGFFSVAGTARQGATADIKDTLAGYGLLTNGGASPLNLDGGALTAGNITSSGTLSGTALNLAAGTVSITATGFGVFGVGSPARVAARTMTGWTSGSNTLRTITRSTATVENLFDFVMTMVNDLKTYGLFQ